MHRRNVDLPDPDGPMTHITSRGRAPAMTMPSATPSAGTDSTYAPSEFLDKDGKTVIGFDVDLFNTVAMLTTSLRSSLIVKTYPSGRTGALTEAAQALGIDCLRTGAGIGDEPSARGSDRWRRCARTGAARARPSPRAPAASEPEGRQDRRGRQRRALCPPALDRFLFEGPAWWRWRGRRSVLSGRAAVFMDEPAEHIGPFDLPDAIRRQDLCRVPALRFGGRHESGDGGSGSWTRRVDRARGGRRWSARRTVAVTTAGQHQPDGEHRRHDEPPHMRAPAPIHPTDDPWG